MRVAQLTTYQAQSTEFVCLTFNKPTNVRHGPVDCVKKLNFTFAGGPRRMQGRLRRTGAFRYFSLDKRNCSLIKKITQIDVLTPHLKVVLCKF